MSVTNKQNHIKHLLIDHHKLTVYVQKSQMNLADDGQLDELYKDDPLFVSLTNDIVEDDQFIFEYEFPQGYQPLREWEISNQEQFQTIANQIMAIQKLDGTQYIPLIQMDNIVVHEATQDVKYVFRGLRMVTAKEDVGIAGIFSDCKRLLLELYKKYSNDPETIKLISQSKSFDQLSQVLQALPDEVKPTPPQIAKTKETEKPPSKYSPETKKLILASVIGLFVGIALMYFVKLLPMEKEMSNQVSAVESVESDIANYEKKLNDREEKLKKRDVQLEAYHYMMKDDHEKAIELLESIDQPNDEAEAMLVDEYIQLNTINALEKALALNVKKKETKIIRDLAEKQKAKANKLILKHSSKNDKVLIEQAYLQKEYKTVIQLANGDDADARMKQLQAKSLLKQEKPDKALKVAKALKDKSLQKESLQLKKEQIENNKKLKEKERKKQLKKIKKQLKAL